MTLLKAIIKYVEQEHCKIKDPVYSLFELVVHGQDGWMAHKGEGQDRNSVDSLCEQNTYSSSQ